MRTLGFDKFAGSEFEQRSIATLARRGEGRKPGVGLAPQPLDAVRG